MPTPESTHILSESEIAELIEDERQRWVQAVESKLERLRARWALSESPDLIRGAEIAYAEILRELGLDDQGGERK